jgi:hypothetical protein
MLRFRFVALAIGVTAWWSSAAPGQTIPARETHVNTPPLILNKGVQKELKLTEDQCKQVEQIAKKVRAKMEKDLAQLEDLEGLEMRKKSKELRENYRKEFPKHLAEVLTPQQLARLKQISLQSVGIKAFVDPDVEKALDLTSDQKKQLKDLDEATHKGTFDVYLKFGQNTKEAREKIEALNKESVAKAVSLLTDKQKQAWKDLVKEPFEVKHEAIPVRPKKEVGGKAGGPLSADLERRLKEDLSWVDGRVAEWQPVSDEKRFDQIGWAKDIREAERLGKENGRPVLLLNTTGNMPQGIC